MSDPNFSPIDYQGTGEQWVPVGTGEVFEGDTIFVTAAPPTAAAPDAPPAPAPVADAPKSGGGLFGLLIAAALVYWRWLR